MSGSWLDQLQPASWRGVPFSVRRSDVGLGRKVAVHEYPFRDVAWPEDMGKKARRFSFQGFVVGDDCYAQEQAMAAACETPGDGTLVHPSYGSITATLLSFSSGQDYEAGRTVTYNFSFIQGAPSPVYPSTTVATGDQVANAANVADLASGDDFASDVQAAVVFGSDVVDAITNFVTYFGYVAAQAADDAGLLASAVAQVVPPPGYTYGRYESGALLTLSSNISTVAQALAEVCSNRTLIVDGIEAAIAAAEQAGNSIALAAAIRSLCQAVLTTAIDPADQVRLLSVMAGFNPGLYNTTAPIGAAINTAQLATSALCRRSALSSLARACAAFNPSSSNQALALRNSMAKIFDAEILIAANANDVGSYQALRALRTAIVLDLNTRAAQLPSLITVTEPLPTPALTIAYQLYADATRCDDLIGRADPVNPLFMPISFVALSA